MGVGIHPAQGMAARDLEVSSRAAQKKSEGAQGKGTQRDRGEGRGTEGSPETGKRSEKGRGGTGAAGGSFTVHCPYLWGRCHGP